MILQVNSDLYKTGTAGFEDQPLPDVLTALDDIRFQLRGYPESDKEKLLLIAMSRYIERRAWQADTGTLRASFQQLSRIADEQGTRKVYETLADSAVKTHVYGVPDWQPPPDLELTTHGGYTDDYTDAWFVIYTPPESDADPVPDSEAAHAHAGLLAIEVGRREWEGFWTFQPSLVTEMNNYIVNNL